jgi:hypothetical protein
MCGATTDVRFVPIADIPRCELYAKRMRNKEATLGMRRPLSGTRAGTGGTVLVPLSFKLKRNFTYCEIRSAS